MFSLFKDFKYTIFESKIKSLKQILNEILFSIRMLKKSAFFPKEVKKYNIFNESRFLSVIHKENFECAPTSFQIKPNI